MFVHINIEALVIYARRGSLQRYIVNATWAYIYFIIIWAKGKSIVRVYVCWMHIVDTRLDNYSFHK